MTKKRLRVYYSGTVQGVGFRFTIERVAAQLYLAGWVRNLPDGRVEAICEGEESKLNEFLDRVKNSALKHYIREVDASWSEVTGEFSDFEIKFW